jgi:hypothetical protein
MKQEIPIRIIVHDPLPNVSMQVQKGKDELLPPAETSANSISFEFMITVDLDPGTPLNFLGKFAQGPKDQRFIYVNSGTYGGQVNTGWARRAKISLMTITRDQVAKAVSSGGKLEAAIQGRNGRDGGPACASVPVVGGWKVVN